MMTIRDEKACDSHLDFRTAPELWKNSGQTEQRAGDTTLTLGLAILSHLVIII